MCSFKNSHFQTATNWKIWTTADKQLPFGVSGKRTTWCVFVINNPMSASRSVCAITCCDLPASPVAQALYHQLIFPGRVFWGSLSFLGLSMNSAKSGAFLSRKALLLVMFKSETVVMGELRARWTHQASCPDPLLSAGHPPLATPQQLFLPQMIYFFSLAAFLPSSSVCWNCHKMDIFPSHARRKISFMSNGEMLEALSDSRTWRWVEINPLLQLPFLL